ncbi:AsmA family protein [Arenibaculum sp.]|jgi:uncharacterized protein involved in outer membrane biogenesis|uniref:AsmA family protein n=1 Tax=Arenibaculum sp. TaxID=2865862 RepID=UPI002E1460B6|nr:AsmA family protein [Arenibaculum sp.]
MGRRRVARIAVYGLCAVALLVLAGYAALRFADLGNTLRPVVAQRIEALTGRTVAITGDFELAPSLVPTVVARGVALANASWASDAPMLRAGQFEVTLQLMPLLLRGDVIVDHLALSDADILLERGPDGRANWQFGDPDAATPEPPADEKARLILFDEVTLRDSRVTWYDAATDRRTRVLIDQIGWLADGPDDALTVAGNGQVGELPFRVAGTLGPLSRLAAGEGPYPLALTGSMGDVEVAAEGRLGLAGAGTDLAVAVSGERLTELGALAGVDLPPLGPYRAEGRLTDTPGGFQIGQIAADAGAPETLSVSIAGGTVAGLPSSPTLDLDVAAEGGSLAALGDLAGASLPAIGPFRLEGRATGPAQAPALTGLSGVAGGEDLAVRLAEGHVGDLLAFADARLPLAVEAADLARLAALFGTEIGAFGPVAAEGVLASRPDGGLAVEGLVATAGGPAAAMRVEGSVSDPLALAGLDLALAMEGSDLGALEPLVGFALPRSEPFRLEGRVAGSVREFAIDPLEAELAGSALTGGLALVLPPDGPPAVEGRLAADRLDLDRIMALAEADQEVADAGEGEVVAAAAEEEEALPVDWLDEVEARLDIAADRVSTGEMEFGRLSAGVTVAGGTLSVRDLTLRTSGGVVEADAEVEQAPGPSMADVTLRMTAEDLPLSELFSGAASEMPATGQIDLDLAIDGTGRTVDQILADLDGDATVTADDGSIRGTQLNYLTPDMDLLRILPFFRNRADRIRVNCLVGRFDIEDGVATTNAMLDTARMTLLGKGTVNLESERLNLALRPVPKSNKLSATSVPVDVSGSITSPDISLREDAPGRILGGLLGGLLVPLNQIASIFGEETVDACTDALGQARERASR